MEVVKGAGDSVGPPEQKTGFITILVSTMDIFTAFGRGLTSFKLKNKTY